MYFTLLLIIWVKFIMESEHLRAATVFMIYAFGFPLGHHSCSLSTK